MTAAVLLALSVAAAAGAGGVVVLARRRPWGRSRSWTARDRDRAPNMRTINPARGANARTWTDQWRAGYRHERIRR